MLILLINNKIHFSKLIKHGSTRCTAQSLLNTKFPISNLQLLISNQYNLIISTNFTIPIVLSFFLITIGCPRGKTKRVYVRCTMLLCLIAVALHMIKLGKNCVQQPQQHHRSSISYTSQLVCDYRRMKLHCSS